MWNWFVYKVMADLQILFFQHHRRICALEVGQQDQGKDFERQIKALTDKYDKQFEELRIRLSKPENEAPSPGSPHTPPWLERRSQLEAQTAKGKV